jgi:hypothetical protein
LEIGDWGRNARSKRGSLVIGDRLSGKRKRRAQPGNVGILPACTASRRAPDAKRREIRDGRLEIGVEQETRGARGGHWLSVIGCQGRGRNVRNRIEAGTAHWLSPLPLPNRTSHFPHPALRSGCLRAAMNRRCGQPHDDGLQAVCANHGGFKPPHHAARSCLCSCWSGRDAHAP